MITVGKIENSATRPGYLKGEFNCQKSEATIIDLVVDDVYPYMEPGDKATVEFPANWNLQEGDTVSLAKLAPLDCDQQRSIAVAWTREELPKPLAFKPNPDLRAPKPR